MDYLYYISNERFMQVFVDKTTYRKESKEMKKLISILLVMTMLWSVVGNTVAQEVSPPETYENIMQECRQAAAEIPEEGMAARNAVDEKRLERIQDRAVSKLRNIGYEAYSVTPEKYAEVEDLLQTDLSQSGVDEDTRCIIVISGEEDSGPSQQSGLQREVRYSGSFKHTYQNKTYTMRWMTVEPIKSLANKKDLLENPTKALIEKCLRSGVVAYISAIDRRIGTVASIINKVIGDFGDYSTAILQFNGAADYTRRFAQVWSSYDSAYLSGGCVEEVEARSSIYYNYYDANLKERVDKVSSVCTLTGYSSKYNDKTWRKNSAVAGYLSGIINYNCVGDITFTLKLPEDGNEKIMFTFRENF